MRPRLLFGLIILGWAAVTAILAYLYVTARTAVPDPGNYETRWDFQLLFFFVRYGVVLILSLATVLGCAYFLGGRAVGRSIPARFARVGALASLAGAASYLHSIRILSSALYRCVQAGGRDAFECQEASIYGWVGIALAAAAMLAFLVAFGLRMRARPA